MVGRSAFLELAQGFGLVTLGVTLKVGTRK